MLTAVLFSFGQGIIHPYYTVALSPALAGVVGIGAVTLWSHRSLLTKYVLAGVFAVTVAWSYTLLARTPAWNPWLRVVLAIGGLVVVGAMFAWPFLSKRTALVVVIAAVAVGLLGPGAYTLATAATPHSGAIPSAGPASANVGGPGGIGRGFAGAARRTGDAARGGRVARRVHRPADRRAGFRRIRRCADRSGAAPGGVGNGAGGGAAGLGGLLNGTTVSTQLKSVLVANHATYRWIAATVDANNAASYQLATGSPVMAIGGFNGTDPFPTLAQFEQDVAKHEIHYFIGGGRGGGPGGQQSSSTSTAIATWVANHFTAKTVGGVTIYDLTAANSKA